MYSGGWKEGVGAHGKGCDFNDNGDVMHDGYFNNSYSYFGDWVEGPHGQGREYDGDRKLVYDGTFNNGLRYIGTWVYPMGAEG